MENITLQQISDLLDARFEAFGKEIDAKLDARFEAFEKKIDAKFEAFEKKIDTKLEVMEERIMGKVIDALNYRFDKNDRDHERIFSEIHKLNDKVADHQQKIMDIQSVLISSNSQKLKYKL